MSPRGVASPALARWAYLLVLAGGFLLMAWLNWPGHLSVDSVLALHEGRFGVRTTWNPALFGWLLGLADRITPGADLMVALSGLLLFGGWAAMAALRPRATWFAPLLALGAVALPQVLIYPAILWKDVLFADAAVAGFVMLGLGLRRGRVSWAWVAPAAVLFAAAGLLRQNGLILAATGAVAIGWVGWRSHRLGGLAAGVGWLAGVFVLTLVLSALARPQGPGAPDTASGRGVRLVQTYDLVAAAALDPGRDFPRIDRVAPELDDYLAKNASRLYAPERIDVLNGDEWFGQRLQLLSNDVIQAEWLDLVTQDPGLYLRIRLLDFQQVFATPVIDKCLPIHLGVDGPPATLEELRMPARRDRDDTRLWNYTTWFLDTPAMSHLPYAAIALGVGVWLLLRREPQDLAMAAMMGGALAFAGSFLVISIACDYRYMYFLDIAAITGALYLALDPRLRRS